MTLPTVGTIAYPTAPEVRDGILRTIKLGLAREGITVNVLPGSDHYVKAEALARRLTVAYANTKIAIEDYSPLTATGDKLEQIAGVFGITKRQPSNATGYVITTSTGVVTIPAGYRAVAPNGETYDVITVSTVASGGTVEVVAVNTGKSTNQDAETKLVWTSAAVGALNVVCTVDAGEIDGGADEDDDETLRRRLLDRLANPSVGGNNASVKATAEDASAAVEAAYVYAALNGPASLSVALTKAEGDRTLSAANVTTVRSALIAALSGHVRVYVTAVTAEEVDIVLRCTLPEAASAGGAGGGWKDASPWPSGTPAAGTNDGKVTAYTAPTATVRTTTAPTVGNAIGIWDADSQVMHEYTIATSGGVSGAYTITVQGLEGSAGFKVSPLSAFVSAGAFNLKAYAATMLSEIEALGPGEKTASLELLPTARRYPIVDNAHPANLDNRVLGNLQKAHPELVTANGLTLATGTTTTLTGPSVPAATTDPPNIMVLAQLAFWKA